MMHLPIPKKEKKKKFPNFIQLLGISISLSANKIPTLKHSIEKRYPT